MISVWNSVKKSAEQFTFLQEMLVYFNFFIIIII